MQGVGEQRQQVRAMQFEGLVLLRTTHSTHLALLLLVGAALLPLVLTRLALFVLQGNVADEACQSALALQGLLTSRS